MALSESEIVTRLKENVARIRDRMAAAAARAGRDYGADLIAVTKYVEPEIVRLLITECRLWQFAESRPQELWRKAEALSGVGRTTAWHLVGHLQRNKVKRTLQEVACIQSVDSLRLMEEISREARGRCHVLIEVNVSGDETKHGIEPNALEPLLAAASELNLNVSGLMTMAGLSGGPDKARRDFAALRQLKERFPQAYSPNINLVDLSMGMSGDFEIAIEEGATMVRIGSALFEGVV